MAIYSTFFLARPESLTAGFPGWKQPLAEPIERVTKNPFTGEVMTIRTSKPEWNDAELGEFEVPEYAAVSIDGNYESYLESRIPPFVHERPHWCAKNLTSIELEPLVAAVLDSDSPELPNALYAPPGCSSGLEQLPSEFVAKLAKADESQVTEFAAEWANRMSQPEFTHSVTGVRLEDDWQTETALECLEPLNELAKQRTTGLEMYLLYEA